MLLTILKVAGVAIPFCAMLLWKSADVIGLIRDWQSLIGSFIALIAAWIAIRPVWRQLDRMEIQTDAMVRDASVARIKDAEWSREYMTIPISNFLDQASPDLEPYEDEEITITPEAAHNWAGTLGVAKRTFAEIAATRLDIASIEVRKQELEAAAGALIGALDDIVAPHTVDAEEHGLTEADIIDLREKAVQGEKAAPELMSKLRKAVGALNHEREQEIVQLRRRLRRIDDRLAAA